MQSSLSATSALHQLFQTQVHHKFIQTLYHSIVFTLSSSKLQFDYLFNLFIIHINFLCILIATFSLFGNIFSLSLSYHMDPNFLPISISILSSSHGLLQNCAKGDVAILVEWRKQFIICRRFIFQNLIIICLCRSNSVGTGILILYTHLDTQDTQSRNPLLDVGSSSTETQHQLRMNSPNISKGYIEIWWLMRYKVPCNVKPNYSH